MQSENNKTMEDNSIIILEAIAMAIKYSGSFKCDPNEVITRDVLLAIVEEAKNNFRDFTYNPE